MKRSPLLSSLFLIGLLSQGFAQQVEEPTLKNLTPEELATRVTESSEALAEVQDELSADVMELVESQTVPQVIELLEEVEKIMAEVTDDLLEAKTGGPTLAAQTEILEKILAAAKKKQQSSGESSPESKESMGAMMDMMERMTGKEPGDQKGPPKDGGKNPSDKGDGGGSTGDSDSANGQNAGSTSEATEERVIPKGSAPSGTGLPNEFRKLLDAYNRNSPAQP